MSRESGPKPLLIVLLALFVVAIATAVFLPRFWENRLYRQAEKIAGVGAPVLPGSITDARRKIDPGMPSEKIVAAIGHPSFSAHTDGSSTHDIWIYYYANGTMTVRLTDGSIQVISVDYNPPRIPVSHRP